MVLQTPCLVWKGERSKTRMSFKTPERLKVLYVKDLSWPRKGQESHLLGWVPLERWETCQHLGESWSEQNGWLCCCLKPGCRQTWPFLSLDCEYPVKSMLLRRSRQSLQKGIFCTEEVLYFADLCTETWILWLNPVSLNTPLLLWRTWGWYWSVWTFDSIPVYIRLDRL